MDTGRACSLLLTSPLAASQNFEYKMSNILDKPLEVRSLPTISAALCHYLISYQLTLIYLLQTRVSSVTSPSFLEHSAPTGTGPC